jgi:hypothetical protein
MLLIVIVIRSAISAEAPPPAALAVAPVVPPQHQTEERHHRKGACRTGGRAADEKPDSDARDQLDTEPKRLAERGALARRRLRVSRPMPALGLAELFAKGVEPPPNFVGVAAGFSAAGLIFGSGHWRGSISGRAFRIGWPQAWPAL